MVPLLALLLLCGFEDDDLRAFGPQDAEIQCVREHATEGHWALKVILQPGRYPGVSVTGRPLQGWSNYDFARLDIFSTQPQPISMTLRVDDRQSTSFGSRYNDDILLRPGHNTIEIPISRLQTSDHKRNLDPARLKLLLLFATQLTQPVILYLDNFRLETGPMPNFEWPVASTNHPYRGIEQDWWPGKDVWQEELLPRVPAVRRELFNQHFFLEPYRPRPNPREFKITAARGQTITMFFNADRPIVSLPGAELRAVRLMERPLGNGVYRIEPTALMPVTNRPHATRFALTLSRPLPGQHRGEVAGIPCKVRVFAFDLPAPQELPIVFGFYYAPPADPGMRDAELRDMAEHGCNSVTAICPRPRRDGTLDTARADEFMEACRRAGLGVRHPVLLPSLSIAQVIAGDYAGPEFCPEFLRLFETGLRQLSTWAKGAFLANPVDEPREQALESWNRNFSDTKHYLELYRAAGIRTLVTLTSDESFGKSYLPLLPLMDVASAHPTRASTGILKAARELHLYNAGMNRLSWGFHPWALGAKGRWEWHYSAWTEAYNPFAPGTGAVMPSPGGPLPTEGYERVRAGIDDYRFVFLLETLIQQNPERGREAKKFLAEIRGKVPRFLEGEPIEEATLDDWREKIAEFIVALQAAAGRNP